MSVVLAAEGLSKAFGGLMAVKDVSFSVAQGEILGLIGPNGAGKTTTFNLIAGVYAPTSGSLHFGGGNIAGKRPYQVAKLGIGRTFQATRIFTKRTVLQNALVGQHCRLKNGLLGTLLTLPGAKAEEAQARERAYELLEIMDVAQYANELAGNIPLAAQRRLGIVIALGTQPRLLLLDEPLAGMRRREKEETMAHINRVRERGITVLLVEHDVTSVMGGCDRIVVLDHGVKIAEGPPKAIRENKAVIEAYLGSETIA